MHDEGVNVSQILHKFFSGCVSRQNQLFSLGQGRRRCPDPHQSATSLGLAIGIPSPLSEGDPVRTEIILTRDVLSSISLKKDEEKTGAAGKCLGSL